MTMTVKDEDSLLFEGPPCAKSCHRTFAPHSWWVQFNLRMESNPFSRTNKFNTNTRLRQRN